MGGGASSTVFQSYYTSHHLGHVHPHWCLFCSGPWRLSRATRLTIHLSSQHSPSLEPLFLSPTAPIDATSSASASGRYTGSPRSKPLARCFWGCNRGTTPVLVLTCILVHGTSTPIRKLAQLYSARLRALNAIICKQ